MPVYDIDRDAFADVIAQLHRDGERVVMVMPHHEYRHVLVVRTEQVPVTR